MPQSGPDEGGRDVLVTMQIAPWVEQFAGVIAKVATRFGWSELPGWVLVPAIWIARVGCKITPL